MKNVSIQLWYAQYYTMIYNCTVTGTKNPIMKTIFLSSMILHRNGFVLTFGSPFSNELKINIQGFISNK